MAPSNNETRQIDDDLDDPCELARRYEYGDGVDRDEEKAFTWYLKAAEYYDVAAISEVAERYETGNGVQKNMEKASEWRRKERLN